MKRFFSSAAAIFMMAIFILSSSSMLAKDATKNIEVKTSAYSWMCKNKIESKINDNAAVESAYLDLDSKTIKISFDSTKIKDADLIEQIKKMGYDAEILSKDSKDKYEKAEGETKKPN